MGNGWFQNQLKDAAGGFFGSDYLRDYTHASKAFTTNLYQYSPKLKFLFHCYFNINNQVYDLDRTIPGNAQNFGILVRDVKLPAYQFQTFQMNQYNRKRIIQTKIKYEPVTFTFIDDNSNTMAKLWNAYYTYYYNDGAIPDVSFGGVRGSRGQDLSVALNTGQVRGLSGAGTVGEAAGPTPDADYRSRTIYDPDLTNKMFWGYDGSSTTSENKPNFFNEITIYGFYQKNFIAYTLINPVITNFAHDTYDYNENNGIMKNTMTLDYETVVYNEGQMDGAKPGNLVPGFGDETVYDRMPSPIAFPGSISKVLGQGGLVDSVGGALKDFQNNPLKGIQTLGTSYRTFKNTNLKQTLKDELKNSFLNNLRQKPNQTRNLSFQFDDPSSGVQNATQAGAPPTGSAYGTSSEQNTNPSDVKVNAQGNPIINTFRTLGNQVRQVFTPIGNALDATGRSLIPPSLKQEKPAGTQSTSGGGVNIAPPGG